jgi:DNA-directed RNA polymerase I, II, and III subunit RPABC2
MSDSEEDYNSDNDTSSEEEEETTTTEIKKPTTTTTTIGTTETDYDDDVEIDDEDSDKEKSDSDSDNDSESSSSEVSIDDDTELDTEDIENLESLDEVTKTTKTTGGKKPNIIQTGGADSDDEDDDDEVYLQKFNEEINKNYIVDNHPECVNMNFDEIISLSNVVRDSNNNIIDDLHMTLPYLTKYEKARILGQRAKQINSGMSAFIKVPENIIDGYLIAEMELNQKRIPFILKRPIPGGGCEFWKVSDLELISF